MTTTTVPANGRARKSLEHQLDRLDSILDGLADALNESVADAVRDAVGLAVTEAVRAVVTELLTNPAIAKKLADAQAVNDPPPPPLKRAWRDRLAAAWRWVKSAAAAVTARVRRAATAVRRAVGATAAVAADRVRTIWAALAAAAAVARMTRKRATAALVVGAAIGVGCYLSGPAVASLVSGAAGTSLAVAAGLVRPLWPFLRLTLSARPPHPARPDHQPAVGHRPARRRTRSRPLISAEDFAMLYRTAAALLAARIDALRAAVAAFPAVARDRVAATLTPVVTGWARAAARAALDVPAALGLADPAEPGPLCAASADPAAVDPAPPPPPDDPPLPDDRPPMGTWLDAAVAAGAAAAAGWLPPLADLPGWVTEAAGLAAAAAAGFVGSVLPGLGVAARAGGAVRALVRLARL